MIYNIFLGGQKIGISFLEKADAPMGVVFGKIISDDNLLSYNFLSKYCKENSIDVTEYPEEKLIMTRTIPLLKVINNKGIEIKGMSSNIEGMDSEGFEVNIEHIPYPFFEEEFPLHVKAYKEQFE